MNYFFPAIVTFVFSLAFTRIILNLSRVLKWLTRKPSEDRWHDNATPSFGGVAMFLSFFIAVIAFQELTPATIKLLVGGSLIFLLGFIDDIRPLPPYVKLVGQIVVACLMVILGVHVALTGNALIYTPLTLIWIVGITNAFNLIDNMDGLAGGVGIIALSSVLALSLLSPGSLSPVMLCILIGSIAGFLVFNVHPAKIFMGDCGSQWLGFSLACLTLMDTWRTASNLFLLLATPVLVLAVPIFDTALVTLNRKLYGRPVSRGGRDHSSHRLVALGLSQQKTVWILWGLSVIFGLTALFAHLYMIETWVLLASGIVIFTLVFGVFLTDAKVYEASPPLIKEAGILRMNFLYKRRVIDILIDTALIGLSYIFSYLLRYDWELNSFLLEQLQLTLPLIVAVKLLTLLTFGLYRGIWTYIDFDGFLQLIRVSFLASLAAVLLTLGLFRFDGYSRTLFVIDFFLLLALMGGSRSLLRAFRESVLAFPEGGVRILIVGAGDAARFLLHEIRRNRHWNLCPVALVDDDQRKHGKSVMGIPVVGGREAISRAIKDNKIEHIVLAIPSAALADQTEILALCKDTGVAFIAMQSLEETLVKQIVR